MSTELPTLIPTQFAATKNYLQDVARVLGKVQQTYLAATPHEWQKGLEVVGSGLQTQALPGTADRVILDMQQGVVHTGDKQWILGQHSAQALLTELGKWLQSHGITNQPSQPEYIVTDEATYDAVQAKALAAALYWTQQAFQKVVPSLVTGEASPVLLYPHHFDVSLVWFPVHDDRQLGFGFSLGDEYIAQPYCYIIASPEPDNFTSVQLTSPAYWFTDGFHGAILQYGDLQKAANPKQTLQLYCSDLISQAQLLFGLPD